MRISDWSSDVCSSDLLRYDDRAMDVVVQAGCPVVLMHAPSAKSDPHEGGTYAHVLFDVHDMLAERIAACVAAGIDPAKIIVDPGLGFEIGRASCRERVCQYV